MRTGSGGWHHLERPHPSGGAVIRDVDHGGAEGSSARHCTLWPHALNIGACVLVCGVNLRAFQV